MKAAMLFIKNKNGNQSGWRIDFNAIAVKLMASAWRCLQAEPAAMRAPEDHRLRTRKANVVAAIKRRR
ncbi:hypothetical protein [Ralstonia pseudosolanacearum]|uniref:hypothetical protein n=1 Tax=Ralstonia pseudosolanacearum TaxID=1310165 RepID=UPI00178C3171|nr:hypothetical protein [Ralstonia pseudosolanacearum]